MAPINCIVLAFFAFLCFHRGMCTRFTITPANGTESLTLNVTLTCQTTTTPSNPNPKALVLIQITHGNDKPIALLFGNGEISYADRTTRRVEAVGHVGQGGVFKGSYLNVILHFPSHQDTGIYKCHVVYLDDVGVANYESSDAYLDIDRPDLQTETRIKSLEALVHDLNMRVQQQLNAQYFSAAIGKKSYRMYNGSTVVFDKVIIREGQGYDEQTGIFTAPVDGVYAFFLALALDGQAMSAGFSLQTNEGNELAKLYLEAIRLGDQSSVSTVTNLKAGDKVNVVVVYLTNRYDAHFYPNNYSVFSGLLIKPM